MIQIVPSDHQPLMEPSPVKAIGEAKEVAAVKPVKPVEERTLPPLVHQRHRRSAYPPGTGELPERRQVGSLQEERRIYCRRIHHQTALEELRSSAERRRYKQRGSDMAEHVDEEI